MWFIHKHVQVECPPLRVAVRQGQMRVEGPRDLARAFPDWIGTSHYVKYGQTVSP